MIEVDESDLIEFFGVAPEAEPASIAMAPGRGSE